MKSKFDIVNEQVLLATFLKDDIHRKKFAKMLDVSVFQGRIHRVIFQAIMDTMRWGQTVDKNTIAVNARGDDFGGFEYVEHLFGMEPLADPEPSMLLLRRDAARIEASLSVEDIHDALTDRTVSFEDCVDKIDAFGSLLKGAPACGKYQAYKADDYMLGLKKRRDGDFIFRSTGFDALDDVMTEGFAPGSMTVMSGRTRMGKTMTMVDTAVRLRKKPEDERPRQLIVALEKGREYFVNMMVSNWTGILLTRIVKFPDRLTDEEMEAIERATKFLLDPAWVVVLDNPFRDLVTNDNMLVVKRIRELLAGEEFDIAMWDLLERAFRDMSPSGISRALFEIQDVGQVTGTHNLISQQLKRSAEDRTKDRNRRPTLIDFKNSGGWEEVTDNGILFHREKVFKQFMKTNVMEMILGKQKIGQDGITVLADFVPECCRLENARLMDEGEEVYEDKPSMRTRE